MNNYYKSQLEKIKANDIGSAAKIKICKGEICTQVISLNDESANELVIWLKENFNIKNDGTNNTD